MTTETRDVIILGAGAAGLMCAIEAGKRSRSVLLLDHAERPGSKILISGGGRCNFTNLLATPDHYLSSSPDFCKSALARYTADDFIQLVESHHIRYHEKKLGQLFCDDSSKRILNMLLEECSRERVELRTRCDVRSVSKPGSFRVETSLGTFDSSSLVIATGGLSFSKLGASDFGHRLAQQFGLNIVEPRPGLVPLTFDGRELESFSSISGVSAPVNVRCGSAVFEDDMLFTHRGLSGPAILQASSYWNPGETLRLDLLPRLHAAKWLMEQPRSGKPLSEILASKLPRRLAEAWCDLHGLHGPSAQLNASQLALAGERLNDWPLTPSGTEGYAKAEVTLGGVDPSCLHSRTLEARDVPGLYFIGEVVDVTGHLGGYNFQWAWSSGAAAGQAV